MRDDRLSEWLESMGDRAPCEHAVDGEEAWMACAGDRPEWMLWGKAMPDAACPAHPLLCHVLDVTAVAARLLTRTLPRALRARLLSIAADELDALRTLLFAVALHDFGKATPAFQGKVGWARDALLRRGFDLNAGPKARHHGDIGLVLLAPELERLGAASRMAWELSRAVTAHHGQFPTDAEARDPSSDERGAKPRWAQARAAIVRAIAELFGLRTLAGLRDLDDAYFVLLAGMTSVADWIGSMSEVFAYEPPQPSLASYWPRALERADRALTVAGMRAPIARAPRSFAALFAREPWPLHLATEALVEELREPSLVVIEAPMGEGKTEAALLIAEAAARVGQEGLYIGLPTQATANQMFGRVESFLHATRGGAASTLLLAHGEASLVERFQALRFAAVFDQGGAPAARGSVRAEAWFLSKKRALLAELAVGTIDQALLSVMLVPHAFVRLYGLAGKTVILDEVHAYDTYTTALLARLLEWLAASGTSVVLLSATLPSERRAELVDAYRRGRGEAPRAPEAAPYPRITMASGAATTVRSFAPRGASRSFALTLEPPEIEGSVEELVARAREGACVGWICNTVARAQRAATLVRELAPELPRLLVHARLLPDDRRGREQRVEEWLGPEDRTKGRPERCIVIGTQVLEQSLDVDFDLLFTDLAPIDLVLQRAGRLWRHLGRTNRGASSAARLAVLRPSGGWLEGDVAAVAPTGVYHPLPVRRSLELLERHDRVTLPDDIEPWVESVYARLGPDHPLHGLQIELFGQRAAHDSLAKQKLMPRPTSDAPLSSLRVFLDDDDDPLLHAQLKAETRLGPPSIELVCVERRGDDLLVGDGDPRPLDPSAEPDRALVSRLVRRSVGVTRPAIVRALAAEPAPEGWKASALLRYRRLVAFEEGRAQVGGVDLRLDPELGLVIS